MNNLTEKLKRDGRHEVAIRITELIVEANAGLWPANIWQWKIVGRKFGIRVKVLPRGLECDAHFRAGVIYLPRRGPVHRHLAHETAEAVVRWEGEPPFIIAGAGDWDRHLIACEVEGYN